MIGVVLVLLGGTVGSFAMHWWLHVRPAGIIDLNNWLERCRAGTDMLRDALNDQTCATMDEFMGRPPGTCRARHERPMWIPR